MLGMISLDAKNICLIGGAAAGVLAGAYILWGPADKRKPKRKDTCPGLVNLGNSCFLNAVLQGLAPCSSVQHWLKRFLQRKSKSTHYLAFTLRKVLKILNNESIEHTSEFCPSDVIDALRAKRWHISSEEQDAHELFHVLTSTLDEETSQYQKNVSLFDVAMIQDDGSDAFRSCNNARNRIDSPMPIVSNKDRDLPVRGLLASQLQCKECSYKCPVKYDTFDSLSLSFPSTFMGQPSLGYLLKRFISSETVHDVGCENCKRKFNFENDTDEPAPKRTFIKKLTLGKLPTCLCVHLQRTVWLNNGMPMKRHEHVSFPEVLNMNEYLYHKPQGTGTSNESDITAMTGLLGGRHWQNGYTKVNSKKMQMSGPTLQVPYSRPVNLLKALNYHSRATVNGLVVKPLEETRRSTTMSDQTSLYIQRLAQSYSSEIPPVMQSNSYKLTSVISHQGDAFSGHFITYRRAPSMNGQRFPDKWFYTSDTLVKRVSLEEVLSAGAYMLFYERI